MNQFFNTLVVFFLSQSAIAQVLWTDELAANIDPNVCIQSFQNGKFIPAAFSFSDSRDFQIFYFLNKPFDFQKPSILFVDGGPGQVTGASNGKLRFADSNDFNVIYFHVRGSGCSAFPNSNEFDKFISPENTLRDMELIRLDLGIKSWAIVYGLSFGSHLSLMYANQFSAIVRKLILEGYFNPVVNSQVIVQELVSNAFTNLENILSWPEFSNLTAAQKKSVVSDCKAIDAGTSTLSPQLQDYLMPSCMSAGGYGANVVDSFMRSFVLWQLEKTLIYPLFKKDGYVPQFPKIAFENQLPYSSDRVNFVMSVQGGLNEGILAMINSYGGLDKLVPLMPTGTSESMISPDILVAPMFDNRTILDNKVETLILQGANDGTTYPDGVRALIAKTLVSKISGYSAVLIPGAGHMRHFRPDCYKLLFSDFIAKGSKGVRSRLINSSACATDTIEPLKFLGDW